MEFKQSYECFLSTPDRANVDAMQFPPHTKSRPLNTLDIKSIIVDAVPLIVGGIDVASSRTQKETLVRVLDAPEKTDDDTIHQAREGTAVTLGRGKLTWLAQFSVHCANMTRFLRLV